MKYYSRSPEEVEDRLSKRAISTSRNRMVGRLLILVNLVLLAGVVLFVRQAKQTESPKPGKEKEPQDVSWNGWTIKSGCQEDKCLVRMVPLKDAGRLVRYQWQMVSSDTGELLYQEVGEPGPATDKTFEGAFKPPFKVSSKAKVYLRMLDAAGTEQFKIRVHP